MWGQMPTEHAQTTNHTFISSSEWFGRLTTAGTWMSPSPVASSGRHVYVAVIGSHNDQTRQPPAFVCHNALVPSGPTIRNSLWALLLAASHAALLSMFPVSARQNRPALIGGQNSSRVPKSRIRNSLAVRVQLRFQSPHLHSSPWSLLTTRSPHILPLRQP